MFGKLTNRTIVSKTGDLCSIYL